MMQLFRLEQKRTSGKKQGGNQYHLAQRQRRIKGVALPEKFEACLLEWEEEEEELDKLTHP